MIPTNSAPQIDIPARLRRINAAVHRTRVTDLARFPVRVINTPMVRGVHHDFGGGASPEDLMNDASSLIENVASLRDHLKKWAKDNGRDPKKVDETIQCSPDLRVIMDLWESDKHGGDRRDGGLSKRSPRLASVDRALRLRTQPKKNSWVTLQAGLDGRLRSFGDGTATLDTSGTVYDGNGNVIGDLQEFVTRAISAWECLLVTYEIGRGLSIN